jgi:HlyD family secretion protein
MGPTEFSPGDAPLQSAREAMILAHELTAHALGGIGESETIMQIVPRAGELVVEAKVALQDIDQVASGAEAVVHIMAGNQRTTPVLIGHVRWVSADITREQRQNSGQPVQAYTAFALRCPQVRRPSKRHSLISGIPAEVFIQTPMSAPGSSTCSSRFASR